MDRYVDTLERGMKLRRYFLRQGDYLLMLAQRYGFDANEVWI
jgi:hypothetical protein